MQNARQPSEDIFGIKRRFCQVCEAGCIGYELNSMMVPSSQEFPTFCKNCKCPAHYHLIAMDPVKDIIFPPELQETIKDHNIQSKDVNFNSVVAIFQVRDTEHEPANVKELLAILKEEGLEVLQLERRPLEVEEAIYIKNRLIGQSETYIQRDTSTGKMNQTTIRQDANHGSAHQTKLATKDPYLMNKFADQKEEKMAKMQQTLLG